MNQNRFRGVRTVTLVTVLEGDGTVESPFSEIDYVLHGTAVLGKVVQVPELLKDFD